MGSFEKKATSRARVVHERGPMPAKSADNGFRPGCAASINQFVGCSCEDLTMLGESSKGATYLYSFSQSALLAPGSRTPDSSGRCQW